MKIKVKKINNLIPHDDPFLKMVAIIAPDYGFFDLRIGEGDYLFLNPKGEVAGKGKMPAHLYRENYDGDWAIGVHEDGYARYLNTDASGAMRARIKNKNADVYTPKPYDPKDSKYKKPEVAISTGPAPWSPEKMAKQARLKAIIKEAKANA